MLPLVVGLLHAPRPHGDGHALKLLQQGQGCISIADATVASVVDDAWCDENCAATPDYEGCIGMCQCPQVAVDRSRGSVDHATDEEMQKKGSDPAADGKCKTKSDTITDEWCNSVCAATPETEACAPVCDCPCQDNACRQRSAKDPDPPKPRIFGGWTNCSPNAKVAKSARQLKLEAEEKKQSSGDCGKDEADILQILDPNWNPMPGEEPPDPELRAGQRDPSYCAEWAVNAVLPGRFGGADIAPLRSPTEDYKYYWITFGGEDTDSSNWAETAEQDIIDAGANGAAFDIEGGVTAEGMMDWIKEMRKKHPEWTYVHVPKSGVNTFADGTYAHDYVAYDPKGGSPDFVAPMMYYTNYNSYPKMDIANPSAAGASEALAALKDLRDAGWPTSRTILTYQSFDAARVRITGDAGLLPLLGKLMTSDFSIDVINWGEKFTLKGPYAGVLGWPAQCGYGDRRCWPELDQANMVEIIRGGREVGLTRGELPDPEDPNMLKAIRQPRNITQKELRQAKHENHIEKEQAKRGHGNGHGDLQRLSKGHGNGHGNGDGKKP
jgi:hypothetical protein